MCSSPCWNIWASKAPMNHKSMSLWLCIWCLNPPVLISVPVVEDYGISSQPPEHDPLSWPSYFDYNFCVAGAFWKMLPRLCFSLIFVVLIWLKGVTLSWQWCLYCACTGIEELCHRLSLGLDHRSGAELRGRRGVYCQWFEKGIGYEWFWSPRISMWKPGKGAALENLAQCPLHRHKTAVQEAPMGGWNRIYSRRYKWMTWLWWLGPGDSCALLISKEDEGDWCVNGFKLNVIFFFFLDSCHKPFLIVLKRIFVHVVFSKPPLQLTKYCCFRKIKIKNAYPLIFKEIKRWL